MHWLILEDSLENRTGHWFEYLSGFHRELPHLGDEVTVVVSKRAESFIKNQLGGQPLLPESVYLSMSDGAPIWERYARVPFHAYKTFWAVRHILKGSPIVDVILVPTVIVHHLLGWVLLIKTTFRYQPTKLLLFFPGLPIHKSGTKAMLDGSASSKLMRFLLHGLAREVQNAKVILGVETQAMKQAAEEVFGVPFTYFPHPVALPNQKAEIRKQKTESLTFACYGPARHEKGSDVLVAAIEEYLKRFPDSRAKFIVQWLDDFSLPDGNKARLTESLLQFPQVEIIHRFFSDGEYARRLSETEVLLLPYRQSAYGLRVSRVAIEGMIHGLPLITTRGTTLAAQAEQFGAAILCEDGTVDSLVQAMHEMERNFHQLKMLAEQQKQKAHEHFSVHQFRKTLLAV